MVPYIHVPDLHIGPLPLHPFGILVATGVLVGTSITARRARKLGYDVLQLNSFVTWMLVSAFVLSHMLELDLLPLGRSRPTPVVGHHVVGGAQLVGGFVGAVIGIVLWKFFVIDDDTVWPRRRQRPAPILPFADLVLSVFPIGWAFGRAGCSTVHDHPGARAAADTLLAVAYPKHPGDGIVTKFGFIELIQVMTRASISAPRAPLHHHRRRVLRADVAAPPPHRNLRHRVGLAYAPVRFAMDFLRIPATDGGDTRYLDLTPAQWSCMVLFLYSFLMIFYVRRLQARGIDLSQSLRERPAPEPPDPAKAPA